MACHICENKINHCRVQTYFLQLPFCFKPLYNSFCSILPCFGKTKPGEYCRSQSELRTCGCGSTLVVNAITPQWEREISSQFFSVDFVLWILNFLFFYLFYFPFFVKWPLTPLHIIFTWGKYIVIYLNLIKWIMVNCKWICDTDTISFLLSFWKKAERV